MFSGRHSVKTISRLMTVFAGLIVTAVLSLATNTQVCAVDYLPYDWVPLPAGTNVLMGYYEFAGHSEFNNVYSGTAKGATSLDSHIGVARYLHYGLIGDHPYVLDFILPFGTLRNGKIGGNRLEDASGMGDPIASVGYWVLSDPDSKRYFSTVVFITIPIGSYDKNRTLNLGGNRWQVDLQADYTQGFGDRYTLDVSGDWIYYFDNRDAGPGHHTLSQRPSYSAYAWLSDDITSEVRKLDPHTGPATISIGYAGTFGGTQRLDGVSTGVKTSEQQIRVSYSQFFTPTLEGTVSLSHDLSAMGQFKQDFGVMFRIAKLF